MLKWVAQKVGLGSAGMHIEEAQKFTEKLKKLGTLEIGAIADMVVEYRIAFERKGIDAANPLEYVKIKPGIVTRFEEFLQDLIKAKEPVRMAAISVWLHTFRAAQAQSAGSQGEEYIKSCKAMWQAVARGFAEEVGGTEFPTGFDPGR